MNRLILLAADNPNFILELFEKFIIDFSGSENRIKKRLQDGHYAQAGIETYKLKGAAGNLGAYALQKACVKLETDIKVGIIKPATLIDFSATLNEVLSACIDYLTPTQLLKFPLIIIMIYKNG
ncbi:MAG: hypothetical protein Q7U98_20020 [Methylicorpusculum sp.]|uniref:Hpt domain-containing protein n=1 Tax=Methylicorpusculum sp. TaxID=2713644 RepID=UPI0027281A21|nr:hypothetical protein [Methylicorpusculum sp.]MDO8845754.1 hypothetical protein [Methylicorpusculum sp.]MDO8941451.1 hypothetical protein [Methylicorpusculum sp.]MDP2178273.1 hypothetical protein [Methylicorpusculum sp.]MDP2204332.1 hypothetical protein [Methylicorpusculum sp.]MDP3531065.1 hypothetical protein [Methylicorpusculum sp.]